METPPKEQVDLEKEAIVSAMFNMNALIQRMYAEVEEMKKSQTPMASRQPDPEHENMSKIVQELRAEVENLKARAPPDEMETPALGEETKERRKSYFAHPAISEYKSTKTSEVATTNLLHVQQGVETRIQMNVISVPATRYLLKTRQSFVSKFSQLKCLMDFVHDDVLTLLVDNEQQLGTPLGQFITHENVRSITDDKVVLGMLALYIRTRTCVTKNALHHTIMTITDELKARSDTWTFGLKGYDVQLHGAVSKYIRKSRQGYELLNQGADKAQTQAWSAEVWGPNEDPGQIRIYGLNLGVFAPCFERQIGLTALKAMKSVPEFLDRLFMVNEQMCGTSLDFRRADALNEPTLSMNDLRARITNTPGRAQRLKEGYGTPRLPSTETPRVFPRTDNHHHNNYNNTNNHNNRTAYPQRDQGNNQNPYPRRDYAPRQASIEYEEYDVDDSYYSGEVSARVAPEPYYPGFGPYDAEGEMLFNDGETYQQDISQYPDMPRIMALPGSPSPRNLFDPKKRVGDPTKPCYVQFYNRCDGSCGGFSHKDEDMVKLRQQQMARLYNSIYGGYDKLQSDLNELKKQPPQQSSPAKQDHRHSSARVAAVETQPTNDPSALYGATSQGLGPLPGSS